MQPVYCQDKNRRYPIPDLVIFFAQSDTSRPVFLHCHMKTKLGSCCFGFLLLIVIRLFTTLPIIVVEKKTWTAHIPLFQGIYVWFGVWPPYSFKTNFTFWCFFPNALLVMQQIRPQYMSGRFLAVESPSRWCCGRWGSGEATPVGMHPSFFAPPGQLHCAVRAHPDSGQHSLLSLAQPARGCVDSPGDASLLRPAELAAPERCSGHILRQRCELSSGTHSWGETPSGGCC